jgi:hypothetical protein
MNNQLKNFLHVLEALDKQKVQYILVGGVAVILHGIERLTGDIDISPILMPGSAPTASIPGYNDFLW